MSVWFFIVLVIGVVYALNRLTTTTDLPVSTRLARAREIVERGGRAEPAGGRPDAAERGAVERGDVSAAARPAPAPGARRYCAPGPVTRRTPARIRHATRH